MIRVDVENIVLNITTSTPIVILKDRKTGSILPIVIGIFEAQAILLILEKESFPRPLTHDLLKSIIEKMKGKILRLEIHSLKENTYYADLVIQTEKGEEVKIDCRPSDGIALALRCSAPIYAAENLMEDPGVVKYYTGKDAMETNVSDRPINQKEVEGFRKLLEQLNAKDFWKKLEDETKDS